MRKTGKWIRNLLTGKRESGNSANLHVSGDDGGDQLHPASPVSFPQPTTPKEKRRWSFRRSSATAPGQQQLNSVENMGSFENDSRKHALAVAASAGAAVAAARAAATAIQLTAAAPRRPGVVEEAAAVRIQSVFRGHLARKALNALKGLVKLQALVRGHLVRKQATATLRCMQALVSVQARARARRLGIAAEEAKSVVQRPYTPRKSIQENKFRNSNQDYDIGSEENIKIVEIDIGDYKPVTKARNSTYSNHTHSDRTQHHMISTHSTPTKQEYHHRISPTPSANIDSTPRTRSNHFDEYSFPTALDSSPKRYPSTVSNPDPTTLQFPYPRSEYGESLCNEYPFYPSYMANTESSRAKARSHSAPKQRPPELPFERPMSRRKPPLDGRSVPRAVRMHRSSSHVGSTAQNHPWAIKLDRSTVSLQESECGSTSTVLSNANYCRSLVGFDVKGGRY